MDNETVLKDISEAFKAQTELITTLNKEIKDLRSGELLTKTPANAGNSTMLHGPGGIFSTPGLDSSVITAHIRPSPGIGAMLPVIPSVDTNPLFPTITGYGAESGTQTDYPCGDSPTGAIQGCVLTAAFGRVQKDSKTIEINDVMLRVNRGEMTDLVLRGALLGNNFAIPPSVNETDVINLIVKTEMVTMGILLERSILPMTWTGTPANNSAHGGYMEFPGLDSQVATGQVDAITGTTCPALDSDVKNFGYKNVAGTSPDIVTWMAAMEHYLYNNASKMGLMPVNWVIAMRPDLWQELSAIWPCRYMTDRCSSVGNSGNSVVVVNDKGNVIERDAMRNGMYIDINGRRYPVIVDDGIFESTNVNNANVPAGSFASSIYFLPLTITGGYPVLYWQYVNYMAATPNINLISKGPVPFWTDGGRFMWAMEFVKYCFKLTVKTEPRIILRTPHLAGKIQNVLYTPLQHVRDFNPDSPYFKKGGVSSREASTYHAVWEAQ
jgi:hypothetical protein